MYRKRFHIIIYVINRIYKVYLNSFGLVLNVLLIFCVKILREMGKVKRKKKNISKPLVRIGPGLYSGPGPRLRDNF
jgi:hypothetical protein